MVQVDHKGERQVKIVRASALDGNCFSITLDSGHTILLELGGRTVQPTFASLIKSGDFCNPHTDGRQIQWPGGAHITLDEIFGMHLTPGDGVQKPSNQQEESF